MAFESRARNRCKALGHVIPSPVSGSLTRPLVPATSSRALSRHACCKPRGMAKRVIGKIDGRRLAVEAVGRTLGRGLATTPRRAGRMGPDNGTLRGRRGPSAKDGGW